MSVVRLEVAAPSPRPGIVALLERLLDEARSGELQAIAVAAVDVRGHAATAYDIGGSRLCELHFAAADVARQLLVHGTP